MCVCVCVAVPAMGTGSGWLELPVDVLWVSNHNRTLLRIGLMNIADIVTGDLLRLLVFCVWFLLVSGPVQESAPRKGRVIRVCVFVCVHAKGHENWRWCACITYEKHQFWREERVEHQGWERRDIKCEWAEHWGGEGVALEGSESLVGYIALDCYTCRVHYIK